jgi:hypothetical protein
LLRRLIVLIFLAAMLPPLTTAAQEKISLSQLEIDLWPEFDQPSMLVIYKATLPSGVSLPVDLTFRIPLAAGSPSAVAVQQVDGKLYSVDYQRQVSGNWVLVTFTATTPQVQMEYYDPSLAKQGTQRHFKYQWPGDYGVDKMTVQVQQPLGATNMILSPQMGSGITGQDELEYYKTDIGSVAADSTFTISVDYQKESEQLTSGTMQVEPTGPINADTPGRLDLRRAVPWALGLLGLVLIAGGGWWYWQSGRDEDTKSPKRRRRKAEPSNVQEITAQGAIYCHQCGKRAEPGDRFCRSCGTRLRTE